MQPGTDLSALCSSACNCIDRFEFVPVLSYETERHVGGSMSEWVVQNNDSFSKSTVQLTFSIQLGAYNWVRIMGANLWHIPDKCASRVIAAVYLYGRAWSRTPVHTLTSIPSTRSHAFAMFPHASTPSTRTHSQCFLSRAPSRTPLSGMCRSARAKNCRIHAAHNQFFRHLGKSLL